MGKLCPSILGWTFAQKYDCCPKWAIRFVGIFYMESARLQLTTLLKGVGLFVFWGVLCHARPTCSEQGRGGTALHGYYYYFPTFPTLYDQSNGKRTSAFAIRHSKIICTRPTLNLFRRKGCISKMWHPAASKHCTFVPFHPCLPFKATTQHPSNGKDDSQTNSGRIPKNDE